MEKYLRATPIVDWTDPGVLARARELLRGARDGLEVAKRCFEWVRDEIPHTRDLGLSEVVCTASQVLHVGSGYCYAKSHLLAALLRANGIPAGFCYQRLSRDGSGPPFCLHGLNAVFLPEIGWYRIDARGNRPGIDARFDPPLERLAFLPSAEGEADLPEVWPDPLPVVTEALMAYKTSDELFENFPDIPLWGAPWTVR